MKIETTLKDMLEEKTWGDWWAVFNYGKPAPAKPGDIISTAAFDLMDVRRVLGSVNGANDGPDWVAVVKLHDGRVATIRAGCDYTGWG